jgi:hypothetical protein
VAEPGIPILHGSNALGGAEGIQSVSEWRQIRWFAVAAGLDVIDKALHEASVVGRWKATIAVLAALRPGFFGSVAGVLDELGFVEVANRRLNGVSDTLADERIRSRRAGAETSNSECAREGNDRYTDESHGSFTAEDENRARRGVVVTPG